MKRLSVFFIISAGCLWGSMGIFVRCLADKALNSMELVSLRSFVTALIMLVFLFIYDKKLLKVRFRDLWCFVGTGICSILFFSYCYFTTINYTSLSLAAVLLYTAPAMVMIMSVFLFKESVNLKKIISVIMAFVGCVLVTGMSGGDYKLNAVGVLTGLGSGFGYALYSIFGRYALKKGYNTLTVLMYTFAFSAIGSVFFCDFLHMGRAVTESAKTIGFAVVFVLVTTVMPYFLYTFGLKNVENSTASVLASVEPVVASLIGAALYKEDMTAAGAIGAVLVLLSAVICNISFSGIKTKFRRKEKR